MSDVTHPTTALASTNDHSDPESTVHGQSTIDGEVSVGATSTGEVSEGATSTGEVSEGATSTEGAMSTHKASEESTNEPHTDAPSDSLVYSCSFDEDLCGLFLSEESKVYIKIVEEVDAETHVFSDASHLCKKSFIIINSSYSLSV